MGTDKKYLKKAIPLIYEELALMVDKNLSPQELVHAKEQLKGHIALSLDSNMELMFSIGKSIMIHDRVDSIQEIYNQIDAIGLKELHDVAKSNFSRPHMSELVYEF